MTKHLIFDTPGQIDLRAFTTFGINVKPCSKNPIGYFGTGLKYAVAVSCRLGGQVKVETDGKTHFFYPRKVDFRGKQFDMIRMKTRDDSLGRWRYGQLPYTTELGKKWEPWMAFRELESNTRDEGGNTYLAEDEKPADPDRTRITVTTPEVVKAYQYIEGIFLPKGLNQRGFSTVLEVYNQPSRHIFYRGLRVMDLNKPSAYTYNFIHPMELTEDRTLKYPFMAKHYITGLVMESDDAKFISSILDLSEEKYFEGSLEFDTADKPERGVFLDVIQERLANGELLPPRVHTFYERHYSRAKDEEISITMRKSEWLAVRHELNRFGDQTKCARFMSELEINL